MIHIANRRNYSGQGVYVGRGTPLGNPFHIGKDGTRAQVIAKYRTWLDMMARVPGSIQAAELARLLTLAREDDLVLICHCVPLACHAEVIRDHLYKLDPGVEE